MIEPLNPVMVEEAIRDSLRTVEEGIVECSVRLDAYRKAEAAYDLAYAHAYDAYPGPAHGKRYGAEISTSTERAIRDSAEVAWRYAERRMRIAELTLSAFQTLSKSVTAAYGTVHE